MELTNRKGQIVKVGNGICMDVNPWKFKEMQTFTFAEFMQKENVSVILLSSNWCHLEPEFDQEAITDSTLQYWMYRLHPLFAKDYKQKCYWIVANRTGKERDV